MSATRAELVALLRHLRSWIEDTSSMRAADFRASIDAALAEPEPGQDGAGVELRRAIFVYEAARIEAIASVRPIVPEEWPERDAAFRDQFVKTVERIRLNPDTTPEKEHDSWWRAYEAMGWRYGPVRDPIAKTHPDMVPFNELEPKEQEKDEVFLALCKFAAVYIKCPLPQAVEVEGEVSDER